MLGSHGDGHSLQACGWTGKSVSSENQKIRRKTSGRKSSEGEVWRKGRQGLLHRAQANLCLLSSGNYQIFIFLYLSGLEHSRERCVASLLSICLSVCLSHIYAPCGMCIMSWHEWGGRSARTCLDLGILACPSSWASEGPWEVRKAEFYTLRIRRCQRCWYWTCLNEK